MAFEEFDAPAPWEPDPLQSVPWAPEVSEPPPPADPQPWATGDADRGFIATDEDYLMDEAYPWANAEPEPFMTRMLAESRGGWGSGPGGEMGFEEYSSPRGILPPGARGMDPQLQDLYNGPPTSYMQEMAPDVAPSLGPISMPPDMWTQQRYDDLGSGASVVPPSMLAGRPGVYKTYVNEQGGGLYNFGDPSNPMGQPYISTTGGPVLPHELGHAMDYQGTGVPQLSGDPAFRETLGGVPDMPRYQRGWSDYYGDDYGRRIPEEVLAEEAKGMMYGGQTFLPPEGEQFIRERLFQQPPGTQQTTPYQPGSQAERNWQQYEQYRRGLPSRARGDW